jgi:hypothetical protein
VRIECTFSTGATEIGRVASVRPVAGALLAATCAWRTGAATPTWDRRGEGDPGASGSELGGVEGLGAPGAGDPGAPALVKPDGPAGRPVGGTEPVVGGARTCCPSMGELCAGVPAPCPLAASRAVEPAVTSFAPRIGAVISSSSSKKSKAEDAMGVVDMSAKGKRIHQKRHVWR